MDWKFTWATDLNPVLLYSAIVSTAVAGWSVYTYLRDGPRLRISVGGNRRLVGEGYLDPKTYLMYEVVNTGTATTTINGLGLFVYDNWWQKFRQKSAAAYVITLAPASTQNLPFVLEPGHRFMGVSFQTPEIVKHTREQIVYVTVWHTMAKRPILMRVAPVEVATEYRV
jgi:hypothetical protein